jgi:hypothetical protein
MVQGTFKAHMTCQHLHTYMQMWLHPTHPVRAGPLWVAPSVCCTQFRIPVEATDMHNCVCYLHRMHTAFKGKA